MCPKFENTSFDNASIAELGADKIEALKKHSTNIKNRKGTFLSASWDYRKLVYAQGSPSATKVLDIEGVKPDERSISSFLNSSMRETLQKITGVGLEIVKPDGSTMQLSVNDTEFDRAEIREDNPHNTVREMFSRLYSQLYKKGLVTIICRINK